MSALVDLIPASNGAAAPYQQIIIAGGDDDVSTGELLEWVHPVLAGIPNGRWSTCELEITPDSEVLARYRSGDSRIELNLVTDWEKDDIAIFGSVIPAASALAIIMLDDHASQVLMLMDGLANWLNMFETSQAELKPIVLLFEKFANVIRSIG